VFNFNRKKSDDVDYGRCNLCKIEKSAKKDSKHPYVCVECETFVCKAHCQMTITCNECLNDM
jgi:hypothetical protein